MTRKLILEFLIVFVIIAGLIALLLPAIQASRDASLFPDGPWGELIPSEPPHESRRLIHQAGFSIIVPPNWEVFDRNPDVQIVARHQGGLRLKSFITIMHSIPDAEILSSWIRTSFNGHVAYEQTMHVERKDTFDESGFSSYQLYVEESGQWWLIVYGLAKECKSLPPEIAAYIKSIRFENG